MTLGVIATSKTPPPTGAPASITQLNGLNNRYTFFDTVTENEATECWSLADGEYQQQANSSYETPLSVKTARASGPAGVITTNSITMTIKYNAYTYPCILPAVNRALLPHLIVVLNMWDPSSMLNWDSEEITAKISTKHQPALVENQTLREHKEALERIHAKIDTLEDLLKQRKRRISKARLKMLLCSDDLNAFFRLGPYHYATNLDKPFSFLETIFSLHPLPDGLASNYYEIMKAVQTADRHSKTKRSAREFCDAVVPAIGSAIALDIYRSREGLPGTLAQIYRGNPDAVWQIIPGTYLSHLREAVVMFENCDCLCDFVSPSGEKCVNALLGHQRATHQNAAGRDIGFGPFESQFLDDSQISWKLDLLVH
ncbi:hypothetical protein BDV11DRAFT_175386 [Aspergillus similis]